jgi:hypothetical protein
VTPQLERNVERIYGGYLAQGKATVQFARPKHSVMITQVT